MTTSLPQPPAELDRDKFAEMGAAFMGARLLCVAAELDLFARLADGPRTLDELVTASGLPRRSLRVLVNGLTALGVLKQEDGRYENSAEAQAFLTGRTAVDQRPGLRLYSQLIYPMWMQFENTVRTGQPTRSTQPSENFGRIFSEGVDAWTAAAAQALPVAYDFAPHRRVLDVGGGTGSYLLPILSHYSGISATLFELPPPAALARRRFAEHPLRNRIAIVEGDALFDPLPEGHDVIVLAGFIHLFNPDVILILLKRLRESVAAGGRLLIVDQWMDATHTRPLFGAMLAATYLLISGDGDTYSVEDAQPWLVSCGWRFVEHRPLAGVTSVIIAEAE